MIFDKKGRIQSLNIGRFRKAGNQCLSRRRRKSSTQNYTINWRNETDALKSVAPYTLVSDKVLRNMAKKGPRTLSQLAQIKNFGEARAKEFGEVITLLEPLILYYCQLN